MIDLNQLEIQRHSTIARVEGWSSARLNFRPVSGGWSASEVFDHLVKTEERILDTAKAGVQDPHRVGFSDRARTVFLHRVFQSERRVKVPATATSVLPDEVCEMDAILRRWSAVRADLAAFRAGLSPQQVRQGIFHHPVGGWMALPDVVEFFSVHMVHHHFQLERLSAESKNL